ncbi:MAG: hypothetical protein M0R80_29325 [Proteobacteria bacterium]|jgi:hypothetical protein|nr:hypothetical protein [Pseudomonadota bacterium]
MIATFNAKQQFKLASRGRVIVGDIASGTIKPGMIATLPAPSGPTTTVVRGVEFIDHVGRRTSEIGLWVDEDILAAVEWDALALPTEFSVVDAADTGAGEMIGDRGHHE